MLLDSLLVLCKCRGFDATTARADFRRNNINYENQSIITAGTDALAGGQPDFHPGNNLVSDFAGPDGRVGLFDAG